MRADGALQTEAFMAAEDGVLEARRTGALASNDLIGASHIGALRALDITLRWMRALIDKELR